MLKNPDMITTYCIIYSGCYFFFLIILLLFNYSCLQGWYLFLNTESHLLFTVIYNISMSTSLLELP